MDATLLLPPGASHAHRCRVGGASQARARRVVARERRLAVRFRRVGEASTARDWRLGEAHPPQTRRVAARTRGFAGASGENLLTGVNFVNRPGLLDSPPARSRLRPRPQAAPDTEPGGGWDSQGKDTR